MYVCTHAASSTVFGSVSAFSTCSCVTINMLVCQHTSREVSKSREEKHEKKIVSRKALGTELTGLRSTLSRKHVKWPACTVVCVARASEGFSVPSKHGS